MRDVGNFLERATIVFAQHKCFALVVFEQFQCGGDEVQKFRRAVFLRFVVQVVVVQNERRAAVALVVQAEITRYAEQKRRNVGHGAFGLRGMKKADKGFLKNIFRFLR